jgi:hypothetical protein
VLSTGVDEGFSFSCRADQNRIRIDLERRTDMPKIVLPIPDRIYHAAFQKTASFMLKSVEEVLVEWLEDGYRERLAQETIESGVADVIKKNEPTLYKKTA